MDKAKLEDKIISMNIKKCCHEPDLDSINIFSYCKFLGIQNKNEIIIT
ncbi:MAG: hypothetical protein WCJ39_07425 [bacterium]